MTSAQPATTNHSRRKGWVVIGAALILGLFAFPATAMAKDDKAPKVAVCEEHQGEYKIKMVNDDKVDKRLDKHEEDGVPGGAVPGMDGYVFDETCVPVVACNASTVHVAFGKETVETGINSSDGTLVATGTRAAIVVPADVLPGNFTVVSKAGNPLADIRIDCNVAVTLNKGGLVTTQVRTP